MKEQLGQYRGTRNDYWETPREWSKWLIKVFGINCDLCATPQSAICERYITEEEDCFKTQWPNGDRDICFMNPPFSEANKFVKEAAWNARKRGVKLVLLYKANFETSVWQDHIFDTAKYLFIPRGRINFCLAGEVASAVPFSTIFAVFNIRMTAQIYLALRQRGQILMQYPEIVDFNFLE